MRQNAETVDAICTLARKMKSQSRKMANIVAYLNRIREWNKTLHFITTHVNPDNPQRKTTYIFPAISSIFYFFFGPFIQSARMQRR